MSGSGLEHFILFTVAGTTYALRSRDVAHVEMLERVTAVPNAAAFVDGVVFSRGQVVPAVNLRARFGFERAAYDVSTRLVVAQNADRNVGLVVDAAREFVSFDHTLIQPPGSALTGLNARYLEGIANVGDRLILVLDITQVLTFDDPVLAAHV
ncbi:MAG TPA: chemotaxis protein CheW [Vicinamibacterales bacterium]|jgi:purine-binding chemotaxis protein CheW